MHHNLCKIMMHWFPLQALQALKWLFENKEITVKLVDKRGCCFSLGERRYTREGLRQITNPDYYLALTTNPLEMMTTQLTDFFIYSKG